MKTEGDNIIYSLWTLKQFVSLDKSSTVKRFTVLPNLAVVVHYLIARIPWLDISSLFQVISPFCNVINIYLLGYLHAMQITACLFHENKISVELLNLKFHKVLTYCTGQERSSWGRKIHLVERSKVKIMEDWKQNFVSRYSKFFFMFLIRLFMKSLEFYRLKGITKIVTLYKIRKV